jgi:imidazolonepropionase-like amidohydrolase
VPTLFVFFHAYEGLKKMKDAMLNEFLQKNKVYLEDSVNTYKKNLRKLYDSGVLIATGTDTDCINFNGSSPVAWECECMVECGLSTLEAIECATKNGADYLGMGDSLGQIKEGYIADIVAVKGNPIEDINSLKEIEAVYQAGEKI